MEKSDEIKFKTTNLIENYNRESKQYSLGKQEVLELTFEQLKTLLEEILVNRGYGKYQHRYEIESLKTPQKYIIEPKSHISKWYPIKKEASIYYEWKSSEKKRQT